MVNVITNFNNFKVVHSDNKIGIGTTNPVSTLDVTGDIRCSNDLYAKDSLVVGYSGGTGDATFSGNIVTDSIVVNSTSRFTSATFSGYIDTHAIVVDGTSTFTGELVASTATLDTIKIKDRIALSTNVDFGSSGYALISGGTSENSWSSVITETAISTLETATGTLKGLIDTNISDISTINGNITNLQNIRSFNISQSAGDYSATDNTVYFSSFYAQTSTDYNRARVYTTINTASFSGRVGVCIFSDSNQAPDSRLAYGESSVQSNISGLQEIVITISDFSSTKNTKYWLGISTDTASGTLYLQKFAYAYTSGEFLRKKTSFYTAGGSPPFSASVSGTISSDVLYYFEIYNPNITESTNELANYLKLNETNSQTITGPIALEDDISLSTNSKIQLGTSYGSSGQVLTSNGSGSAPTWQTVSSSAYYLYAYKNSIQTINNKTYTDIIGFTVDNNASTTEASGDFNTSTGQWTPPQGVYILLCRSRVFPTSGTSITDSNISRVIFIFADTSNNEMYTDDNMNEENADGTDIYSKTVTISTIIYANGSTTYKLRMWVRRDPSAQSRVGSVSGTRDDTTISAYKIG